MHQTDGTQWGGGSSTEVAMSPRTKVPRPPTGDAKPAAPAGRGCRKKPRYLPAEPPRCSRGQRGALLSRATEDVMGGVGPLGPFPPESQNPSSQAMPQAGGGILWATVHRNHPSLATRIHLTAKPHPEIPINPSAFTPNIE